MLSAAISPPPDQAIVVTASRTERAPPGAVSVVSRDDIERRQPASLLDMLNDVAGVRAFSTGGIGGRSFLSIRGGEPNFTLVLLDGIRLNDPTNSRGGGFDFFLIDPALVERIDVVRGAASAVHGSDALSGLVNVTLVGPTPGTSGASLRAQGGTGGDAGVGGSVRAGWHDGGLIAGGSRYDSGGLTSGSSLDRWQGLAELRQRLGGFEAQLTGLYGDARRSAFPEDSGGPRLAIVRDRERGTSAFAAGAASIRRDEAAAIRPHLSLAWSRQRDDSITPAIAPGALQGVPALSANTRFTRIEAVADVGFGRGPLVATLGGAWLRESGRSDGSIDFGFPLPVRFALERKTRSAFAEASLRPGAGFSLNLAGRYDSTNGDGRFTMRAGAAWQPASGGPTLFVRSADGYKLPSFYALGHPLVGNPSLRPERSRNLEAGIERKSAATFLRATLFRNRFRDLIDFDPILFKTVNRDRVTATGAELEGQWHPLASIELAGALSWLDLESPTKLRGRPRWQGSLRAAWQATRALELNAAIRFNSSYHDSSIPTGLIAAKGHGEADLGLVYHLSSRLGLVVAASNVTDSHYEDAVGFPAPGAQLRAALTVDLF